MTDEAWRDVDEKMAPAQEVMHAMAVLDEKHEPVAEVTTELKAQSHAVCEQTASIEPVTIPTEHVDDGEVYNPVVDDSAVAFLPDEDAELELEIRLAQFPMPPTSTPPSPKPSQVDATLDDANPSVEQDATEKIDVEPVPPANEDVEIYEPRAAYDFVDEDELDVEAESPSALTSAQLGLVSQGAEGLTDSGGDGKDIEGIEEEREVWEGRGGRLTPCGDDEEMAFEDVKNVGGVDVQPQAMIGVDAILDPELERERGPKKAEASTQTQAPSVETTEGVQVAVDESVAMQDTKEMQTQTALERLEAIKEVEEPIPEVEKEKKRKEERIMSPEEETKWAAYLERRREACERVSVSHTSMHSFLPHLLAII